MARKTNCEVNGKKKYRLRVKLDDGKVKNFYGDSKSDAEAKRDEYISRGVKTYLFKDRFIMWMEYIKKPTLARSSYNKIEEKWRVHIEPSDLCNLNLSEIDSLDIQKFVNGLPTHGVAKKCLGHIKSFFRYCLKERLIVYNPTINIQLPAKKEVADKKKYLTDSDLEKIKKADIDFIYQFALLTGLRQGEILALRHEDVDINNRTIKVYKSLSRESDDNRKSVTVVKRTKNESSIRVAPLPESLLPGLNKHIINEKTKHLSLGVSFNDKNLLFTNSICKAMRRDRVTSKWRNIQINLAIDPITFHGLRHTFCTLLSKNDVDLKTASALMGHSNISTTATIYTHVDEKRKKEAVEKIQNLL